MHTRSAGETAGCTLGVRGRPRGACRPCPLQAGQELLSSRQAQRHSLSPDSATLPKKPKLMGV